MEARANTGQVPAAGQAERMQGICLIVDTIPTLAWPARPDGSADFFNQRWLGYKRFVKFTIST
jgi:hypothetical protein